MKATLRERFFTLIASSLRSLTNVRGFGGGNGNKKRNQENLLAKLAKEFKDFFDFLWRLKPPKLGNLCPSGEIFFTGTAKRESFFSTTNKR